MVLTRRRDRSGSMRGGVSLAIGGGVAGPARDQRRVFRNPRPVVVFDLVVDRPRVQGSTTRSRLRGFLRRRLGLRQQPHQFPDILRREIAKNIGDPGLVFGRHLAKLGAAGLGQPDHLHAAIGVRRAPVEMAGFDQALDQSGDVAVRHHHPLGDIRQRHAVGHLVELGHQVEARQRDIEPLAQPAAHLALDQGGAGQQPQPQPELVAMLVRQFDGLGFGIKDHGAIIFWRCRCQTTAPRDLGLQYWLIGAVSQSTGCRNSATVSQISLGFKQLARGLHAGA